MKKKRGAWLPDLAVSLVALCPKKQTNIAVLARKFDLIRTGYSRAQNCRRAE